MDEQGISTAPEESDGASADDQGSAAAPEESGGVVRYDPGDPLLERVKNDFTYHSPKDGQVERFVSIRQSCQALARTIVVVTPPGREQSLALTKLDEVVMWANAAIARNE